MNNTEYVEKMINRAERILVDTSTLMKSGFQQFVCRNIDFLKASGKPIIVINAVYTELARNMKSDDLERVQAAVAAVALLDMHKDLFHVESSPLTDEEIERAFADIDLLSDITLHRNRCRQLLIVNDRNLGQDAYNLNKQTSCKGHKVYVCYIDWDGELQCCDCVCSKSFDASTEDIQVTDDNTKQAPQVEQSTTTTDDNNSGWKFDWKSGLLVATGTIVFYGAYRFIKAIL